MPAPSPSSSGAYVTARRLRFVPGPRSSSHLAASVPAHTTVKAVLNDWGSATLLFSLDREDDYEMADAVEDVDFVRSERPAPAVHSNGYGSRAGASFKQSPTH